MFLIAGTVENPDPKFTITDIKLYVPVVTFSTQDNAKLLRLLESGFKRTINWNKYQSKLTQQTLNRNLDFLIDPSFWGVNRLFILSFKDRRVWQSYKQFFVSTVEIKDYNVVLDWRNFFDQPVRNDLRTHGNIRKIAICQGDEHTSGCLIDYPYFKNYKVIPVDLSKQQNLDTDQKAIKQINFTGNLDWGGITQMFFIIEEVKETVLDFQKEQVKCYDFVLF